MTNNATTFPLLPCGCHAISPILCGGGLGVGSFRFLQNLAMTNECASITINALNANKEPKKPFYQKKNDFKTGSNSLWQNKRRILIHAKIEPIAKNHARIRTPRELWLALLVKVVFWLFYRELFSLVALIFC